MKNKKDVWIKYILLSSFKCTKAWVNKKVNLPFSPNLRTLFYISLSALLHKSQPLCHDYKYKLRVDDILWEIKKCKDFKYEQNSDIARRGCNLLVKATLKPQVWLRCGKSTRYSIICSCQVVFQSSFLYISTSSKARLWRVW